MKKKILIGAAIVGVIALAAVATVYVLYGRDHYDASKYQSEISNGLEIGSTISFTLPDQFDVAHTIGPETRTLIVASGRKASRAAKELIDEQADDFLAARAAMFVIDISAAPTVIRNKFMLPRLKESAYPIVLIYEEPIAAKLTSEAHPDSVAVIALEDNIVRAVSFAATGDELLAALSRD